MARPSARPFIVYGRPGSDDTARARKHLDERGVTYTYVDVTRDPEADRFVILANHGERVTPTIVMGPEGDRTILRTPSNDEIDRALDALGYTDAQPEPGDKSAHA